ncbi:MAG: GNAT family N-acetyltransferase [Patescibacteria group bacterium]
MLFKRLKNYGSWKTSGAFNIYQDSFPEEVKRNRINQIRVFKDKKYHFDGVYKNKKMVAIFAYWRLNTGDFIEHFAVKKSLRRQGLGREVIRQFIRQAKRKIIIEVEKEDIKKSARLIRFYRRLGFKLNKYVYCMPPYKKGGRPIPFYIMTYSKAINKKEFLRARHEIYKTVYKVK